MRYCGITFFHWWYLSAWQYKATHCMSLPSFSTAKRRSCLIMASKFYPQTNTSGTFFIADFVKGTLHQKHYKDCSWLYWMNGKTPPMPYQYWCLYVLSLCSCDCSPRRTDTDHFNTLWLIHSMWHTSAWIHQVQNGVAFS